MDAKLLGLTARPCVSWSLYFLPLCVSLACAECTWLIQSDRYHVVFRYSISSHCLLHTVIRRPCEPTFRIRIHSKHKHPSNHAQPSRPCARQTFKRPGLAGTKSRLGTSEATTELDRVDTPHGCHWTERACQISGNPPRAARRGRGVSTLAPRSLHRIDPYCASPSIQRGTDRRRRSASLESRAVCAQRGFLGASRSPRSLEPPRVELRKSGARKRCPVRTASPSRPAHELGAPREGRKAGTSPRRSRRHSLHIRCLSRAQNAGVSGGIGPCHLDQCRDADVAQRDGAHTPFRRRACVRACLRAIASALGNKETKFNVLS